ncbi:hypothetical protein TNCV_4290161 [Trichonephila clavipes]|nr:hypothetical protein TNCV_4290161 [Trichonephila clavipes]
MKIYRLGPGSKPKPWVQKASEKPTTLPCWLKKYEAKSNEIQKGFSSLDGAYVIEDNQRYSHPVDDKTVISTEELGYEIEKEITDNILSEKNQTDNE